MLLEAAPLAADPVMDFVRFWAEAGATTRKISSREIGEPGIVINFDFSRAASVSKHIAKRRHPRYHVVG